MRTVLVVKKHRTHMPFKPLFCDCHRCHRSVTTVFSPVFIRVCVTVTEVGGNTKRRQPQGTRVINCEYSNFDHNGVSAGQVYWRPERGRRDIITLATLRSHAMRAPSPHRKGGARVASRGKCIKGVQYDYFVGVAGASTFSIPAT